ncbi:acyl-CoA dehydrogenase family protein [Amycolatopsis sp. NPDC059657]|uniref:acyl-CoA dehydrogenase family protein n=1 Tax=Amycolatopsis sp. NPDC059657 TaxID=3346899 RepID=UPI0036714803
MDFSLTEAQSDLSALTRKILADRVTTWEPHGTGGFDAALWATLARSGIVDAALPSSAGGGGFGLLEQCSVLIEIGRAVAPVPYLTSVVMAAAAVAEAGDGRLTEKWVVPVLRGEQTLAAALDGFTASGSVLSGSQTAVPFGAFADGFLVAASDRLFLVERSAPGVTVSAQQTIDNADAALLELDEVRAEPLPGSPEWVRLRGTVGVCAQQLGVLERALELTATYARERRQFGHPIGSFQAVRQRLAEAYMDVDAVRLTLWQAAWQVLDGGQGAAETVATAKFWAAEAGHRVAHTAVHVHGGVGIDVDHPLHRYFAAAKRLEFTLGSGISHLRALGSLLATQH